MSKHFSRPLTDFKSTLLLVGWGFVSVSIYVFSLFANNSSHNATVNFYAPLIMVGILFLVAVYIIFTNTNRFIKKIDHAVVIGSRVIVPPLATDQEDSCLLIILDKLSSELEVTPEMFDQLAVGTKVKVVYNQQTRKVNELDILDAPSSAALSQSQAQIKSQFDLLALSGHNQKIKIIISIITGFFGLQFFLKFFFPQKSLPVSQPDSNQSISEPTLWPTSVVDSINQLQLAQRNKKIFFQLVDNQSALLPVDQVTIISPNCQEFSKIKQDISPEEMKKMIDSWAVNLHQQVTINRTHAVFDYEFECHEDKFDHLLVIEKNSQIEAWFDQVEFWMANDNQTQLFIEQLVLNDQNKFIRQSFIYDLRTKQTVVLPKVACNSGLANFSQDYLITYADQAVSSTADASTTQFCVWNNQAQLQNSFLANPDYFQSAKIPNYNGWQVGLKSNNPQDIYLYAWDKSDKSSEYYCRVYQMQDYYQSYIGYFEHQSEGSAPYCPKMIFKFDQAGELSQWVDPLEIDYVASEQTILDAEQTLHQLKVSYPASWFVNQTQTSLEIENQRCAFCENQARLQIIYLGETSSPSMTVKQYLESLEDKFNQQEAASLEAGNLPTTPGFVNRWLRDAKYIFSAVDAAETSYLPDSGFDFYLIKNQQIYEIIVFSAFNSSNHQLFRLGPQDPITPILKSIEIAGQKILN